MRRLVGADSLRSNNRFFGGLAAHGKSRPPPRLERRLVGADSRRTAIGFRAT
jgi:hypothetical protein